MANDKSFQDPTNLENKIQRHQEFVAEVNANEQRIQKIAKVGIGVAGYMTKIPACKK